MHELSLVSVRLVKEASLYSGEYLNSPERAVEFIIRELAQYDREVLCILNLAENKQPINMNIVSVGTVNSALVSPREIFKGSILSNASSIIAVHNHPGGSVMPSEADFNVTSRIGKSGELLGIPLLDHIIVGGGNGKWLSFREEDILWRKNEMTSKRHERFREKKKGWER